MQLLVGSNEPRHRSARRHVARNDPLVERVARRVTRLRMGKSQQVALRPAVARLVFHHLIGERIEILPFVPRRDSATQRSAPAPLPVDE